MTGERRVDHDVVVVGDGPAGLALAAACSAAGVDVAVVGRGAEWSATYGAWDDELGDHRGAVARTMDIDVIGARRHRLDRRYAIFDNQSLRAGLDVAPRVVGEVVAIDHLVGRSIIRCAERASDVTARLVVDARGPRSSPGVAVQRAYGLVLGSRPGALEGDRAVLMDWRQPAPGTAGRGSGDDHPTFLYAVALGGGRWLVEETSLARRQPVSADVLRARLAARLGDDLTGEASAVEHVSIPMSPGRPTPNSPTVLFGAAAGYVHPATGYSVAASLHAAPRVAAALAATVGVGDQLQRSGIVDAAVWPTSQRRARALHDYGLAALLRLPASDIQHFFDAFFSLPSSEWSAYLRVDTDAAAVSRVMASVFRSVPWALRGRLAAGDPRPFLELLRRSS